MNAQRKQNPSPFRESLERFSATLDADASRVMESIGFIGSDPEPANPGDVAPRQSSSLRLVLRRADQLARLINVIGVQLGGSPEDVEPALVGLASELSGELHAELEKVINEAPAGLYEASGRLDAIVFSMLATLPALAASSEGNEIRACANRMGWLQDAAGDLSGALVAALEGRA